MAILLVALVAPLRADDSGTVDPEDLSGRMLAALGGRASWAGLTSLVNDSQQNRLEPPTVVRAVITLDLARPRFRVETSASDLHLVRVVDGVGGWRYDRAGELEDLPAHALADDLRWHATSVRG